MKTLKHSKKIIGVAILLSALTFTSCDILEEHLGLSLERVAEGLKKALNIGTDDASSKLAATDGFYMDAAAKILLPEEANNLLEKRHNPIFQSLGLDKKISDEMENIVLGINRSAEDAAQEVAPIFSSAITDLTIDDGFDILNGIVPNDTSSLKSSSDFDSTAATTYLQNQTFQSLVGVFSPKINTSLDKEDLGLGISANSAWTNLQNLYNGGVEKYNQAIDYQNTVNNFGGLDLFAKQGFELPELGFDLPGVDVLNLDLGEKMVKMDINLADHCTGRALDAVFGKIKIVEKDIRRDPDKFKDELISEVFGSVFEE